MTEGHALRIADLLYDEDTTVAFVSGDANETAMRVALAVDLVTQFEYEAEQAVESAVQAKFEQRWMRDDPADPYGERMLPCESSDPAAFLFSMLTGFSDD
jgi:hypothetical protein